MDYTSSVSVPAAGLFVEIYWQSPVTLQAYLDTFTVSGEPSMELYRTCGAPVTKTEFYFCSCDNGRGVAFPSAGEAVEYVRRRFGWFDSWCAIDMTTMLATVGEYDFEGMSNDGECHRIIVTRVPGRIVDGCGGG